VNPARNRTFGGIIHDRLVCKSVDQRTASTSFSMALRLIQFACYVL
jgi:hypothetical protein